MLRDDESESVWVNLFLSFPTIYFNSRRESGKESNRKCFDMIGAICRWSLSISGYAKDDAAITICSISS